MASSSIPGPTLSVANHPVSVTKSAHMERRVLNAARNEPHKLCERLRRLGSGARVLDGHLAVPGALLELGSTLLQTWTICLATLAEAGRYCPRMPSSRCNYTDQRLA